MQRSSTSFTSWSVDHGHFLGGPGVPFPPDPAHLAAPQVDPYIVQSASLNTSELESAKTKLLSVMPEQVAEAIAGLPDEWGIMPDGRVKLAELLWERRALLLRI